MVKGCVIMEQKNLEKENIKHINNASRNGGSSQQDSYSNQHGADQYGSVEPLPESSRPRRDGPGGEDNE